jgi:hypothetical protein
MRGALAAAACLTALLQVGGTTTAYKLAGLNDRVSFLQTLVSSLVCKSGDEVLATGAWCLKADGDKEIAPGHPLATMHVPVDAGLASFFQRFFKGKSVTDLGAGIGQYGLAFQGTDIRWTGYDGAINVEEFTHGLVRWADLSMPLFAHASDWVMCLEVGEHLPAAFQDQLLSNIHSLNVCGVVLSWATPGQGGHSHVNERTNEAVLADMVRLGYAYNSSASQQGRAAASYGWFHNTLMVFDKKGAPRERCA